jgi:hypothetical protein
VTEVTLAPAVARQLAEPARGGPESYYWMSGRTTARPSPRC